MAGCLRQVSGDALSARLLFFGQKMDPAECAYGAWLPSASSVGKQKVTKHLYLGRKTVMMILAFAGLSCSCSLAP